VTKIIKDTVIGDAEDIHPEAAVATGYLANHASRVFNRLVDSRLRNHDLSLSLIGPLLLLSWKGPMLQRDLVQHSAVKQPAMVALLDKLEAAGMIGRAQSTSDKRAATVELTDSGREAAAIGRNVLLEMNEKAVDGFATEDAALVVKLLSRVIANLEAPSGT
jgi:DNA-binding MarR family transcriptional regulator